MILQLLETQQQLAVAISTEKRKDLMIEQLDKVTCVVRWNILSKIFTCRLQGILLVISFFSLAIGKGSGRLEDSRWRERRHVDQVTDRESENRGEAIQTGSGD